MELKSQKEKREKEGVKFKGKILTRNWAEFSDLAELYYKLYSQLNAPVHGLSRELEQYAAVDKNGQIANMNWGPNIEGVDIVLTTIMDLMCHALWHTHILFGLSNDEVDKHCKKNKDFKISSNDMRIKSFINISEGK